MINIQRYFPDFFPSCYTEKRINLSALLSEIEKKDLDTLIGPVGADPEETGFLGLDWNKTIAKVGSGLSGLWNQFNTSLGVLRTATADDRLEDK